LWQKSGASLRPHKSLERTKFLAPPEPDLEMGDDEAEEEPWLENPTLGAEELLRFPRIRQLLQQ